MNGVVPWLTLLLYGRKPFGKDFINICLYVIFFLKNTFDWLIEQDVQISRVRMKDFKLSGMIGGVGELHDPE